MRFGYQESDSIFCRAVDSLSSLHCEQPDQFSSLSSLRCRQSNQLENVEFWDDLSGRSLSPDLVRKARIEEMGEIIKHRVYEKVPISECWNQNGQAPIGTRWVDVNKGDDQKVEYRSRLVAQELNHTKDKISSQRRPRLRRKSCSCHWPLQKELDFLEDVSPKARS